MQVTTPADFLRSGLFWRITAAREARRLILLKVATDGNAVVTTKRLIGYFKRRQALKELERKRELLCSI